MADKKDVPEEISEDELDQIIQDMSAVEEPEAPAKRPALEVVAKEPHPTEEADVAKEPAEKEEAVTFRAPASDQSLSMEMSGVVNLKLSFKNGERTIDLTCSENELVCRMADGTEFRIPTGYGKAHKVAA